MRKNLLEQLSNLSYQKHIHIYILSFLLLLCTYSKIVYTTTTTIHIPYFVFMFCVMFCQFYTPGVTLLSFNYIIYS